MANWDWCTFVLLLVLSIVVIALLVAGTYFTMTYFRMVEKGQPTSKHPTSKWRNSSPAHLSDLPTAAGQMNPQPQHYSEPRPALPNWQHQEHNSPPGWPPYMSPTGAGNPYSQLSPEQQQQAMAQYMQAMYLQQYMQQLMNTANEKHKDKQGRAAK